MDRYSAVISPVIQEHWSIYFDGTFTLNGVRGGVILISPKGDRLLYVIRLHFRATNNVAEYEALINNLRITTKLGVQQLYICGDCELIVNQVMGESNYRDSHMVAYWQEVRKLEEKFDGFELHHILQRDNDAADALAWLESSRELPPPGVFTNDLFKPSIYLEKDVPTSAPWISLGEDGLTPTSGTPPGKYDVASASEADPVTSTGPIRQGQEPRG
jgi:ribonuclease HI